jgi:hypothetical protein
MSTGDTKDKLYSIRNANKSTARDDFCSLLIGLQAGVVFFAWYTRWSSSPQQQRVKLILPFTECDVNDNNWGRVVNCVFNWPGYLLPVCLHVVRRHSEWNAESHTWEPSIAKRCLLSTSPVTDSITIFASVVVIPADDMVPCGWTGDTTKVWILSCILVQKS